MMTRAVWVQTGTQREHLMKVKVTGSFHKPSSVKGCQPRKEKSGRERVLTECRQAALRSSPDLRGLVQAGLRLGSC